MFTKKKMLAGFLTLAMLLSLMTGMLVPARAAGTEAVYQRKPEESYQRIVEQIKCLFPKTEEKAIHRFLK